MKAKEMYVSIKQSLGDVVRTAYEVAMLGPELAVTIAKNPSSRNIAMAAGAAYITMHFLGCNTAQKQVNPTAKALQTAAYTEQYANASVNTLAKMLEDGKLDVDELNALTGGKKQLDKAAKTLEEELKAAKERKDGAAEGALEKVQKELKEAYGAVNTVLEFVSKDGKTKVYFAFNNLRGEGLKPSEQGRYIVVMTDQEADGITDSAEWKKTGISVLKQYVERIGDKSAKDTTTYMLDSGQIDPSSVHVKVERQPVELKEEQLKQANGKIKTFRETYVEKPEEKKETEQKPEKPEENKNK